VLARVVQDTCLTFVIGLPPHTLITRVTVSPGATVNLPIEPAADHGWAHVIQGSIDVAGGGAMDEAAGIAVFTSGDHLTLSNPGESAVCVPMEKVL